MSFFIAFFISYITLFDQGVTKAINISDSLFPNKKILLESFDDYLKSEKAHPQIGKLIKLASHLEKFIDEGEEKKQTFKSYLLKKGDKGSDVILLKKYLKARGYLNNPDLSKDVFTKIEELALKKFQRAMFLKDDGVLGPQTKSKLIMSFRQYFNLAIKNLKRWETYHKKTKDLKKHVLVNIPTFQLQAFDDQMLSLKSPVIVGLKHRKTPLMMTHIMRVVVNPTWGVPKSIFLRDKLHRIQEDPDYLIKRNYKVFDFRGNIHDPNSIDWEDIDASYMPYYIRQNPGINNALGLLKLEMDNPYTIYMHDTNQRDLFDRRYRALSSGCIRVKKPVELASWALKSDKKDADNWFISLKDKMDGEKTRYYKVHQKIPVFIEYITLWVNEDGTFSYSDPYN